MAMLGGPTEDKHKRRVDAETHGLVGQAQRERHRGGPARAAVSLARAYSVRALSIRLTASKLSKKIDDYGKMHMTLTKPPPGA